MRYIQAPHRRRSHTDNQFLPDNPGVRGTAHIDQQEVFVAKQQHAASQDEVQHIEVAEEAAAVDRVQQALRRTVSVGNDTAG